MVIHEINTLSFDVDEFALAVWSVGAVGTTEVNLLWVGLHIDGFVRLLLWEDFLPWLDLWFLGRDGWHFELLLVVIGGKWLLLEGLELVDVCVCVCVSRDIWKSYIYMLRVIMIECHMDLQIESGMIHSPISTAVSEGYRTRTLLVFEQKCVAYCPCLPAMLVTVHSRNRNRAAEQFRCQT